MERDWEAVRNAYLNGEGSIDGLGKRFGIPRSTVHYRAKREGWEALRQETAARTVERTVERISEQNSQRITLLADRLIRKLEKAVDELDVRVVTVKSSREVDGVTETNQYVALDQQSPAPVDPRQVKRLTDALQSLKTVMDIRAPLDREEQEARIRRLQKEAGQEDKQEVVVTLKGLEELAG